MRAKSILAGPAIVEEKIVVGADKQTGERVGVSRSQLNNHTVVIGRSGRGKTETILTLCDGAAKLGMPILFVDGKGDPAVLEGLRSIALGSAKKFYAFDSIAPEVSCAWDIFADLGPTTQADIIVRLRKFSEPHYEAKAAKFALVACKVMRHTGQKVDVFSFHRSLSVNWLLASLRHRARKDDVAGRELMQEVTELRAIEKEAVDSLMSEVGRLKDASCGWLFDVKRALEEKRELLRLTQARRENAIVYVGLPALEYPETAAKVGALAIAALKANLPILDRENSLQSKTPLPLEKKQIFCVFDEWASFAGGGDHIRGVVNMGRSWGASACLAGQSCADFFVDGNDTLLRQVAGSCANFIVHECNDPQDAEYAASLFGTVDAISYTAQTMGGAPTGAASARRTKVFVVHPDDIKNIGVGEAFLMNKNEKNKKTNRSVVRLVRIRRRGQLPN
ncbi:MAG: hypothetical protein CFE29_03655 [Bradyrhizobiaceae bacterium PARB1]|jgi:hypothetical protein|nr:MAG: hypothetical protein CFE29_03655 [Bradyrhizobiaceae bacterium PARB1]